MDLDELVFHPWVLQGPRNVPTFVAGSGSYLIDADGRRYLDFSLQLVFTNLGHQHCASLRPSRRKPTGFARLHPLMHLTSAVKRRG
jgi:4-aminobutyrate aminotransferase-like enzyme